MYNRHANNRLVIGPRTREIILNLDRVYGTTFATENVDVFLNVIKRSKRSRNITQWVAYAVDANGNAHFEIPDDFLITSPKGFYDATLMMGGCHVDELEIIKAPSVYVKCSKAVDTQCVQTKWQEPNCEPDENIECGCDCNGAMNRKCSCAHPSGGSCTSCKPNIVVVKANLNPSYSGIPL